MATVKEFNEYGTILENWLPFRTSPLAVKMLESEADIPEEAYRPYRDDGIHYAQCQAFALSRRDKKTVAMLKEDNWCPGAVLAYGLVPKPDDPAARAANTYDSFEYGKYIGILTAPLSSADFKPDVIIIYCDTNQLRIILLSLKTEERPLVKYNFFPISCATAVVPVMLHNEYWINLPDPGEYSRALTTAGEMMFSLPESRLPEFVQNLRQFDKNESGFQHERMTMMPNFPQPDLYRHVFESWDMDHE